MPEFDKNEPIGAYIQREVLPPGMSVSRAAELLSVSRPTLSKLLNGRSKLSEKMAAALEKAFGADRENLLSLQRGVEAESVSEGISELPVRTYAPSFLEIRAGNIEAWADKLDARQLMGALLRRLVNSSGAKVSEVSFPAYDDSQTPGWDGWILCDDGDAWVPRGASGWEFGTNKDIKRKADGDYEARTRSLPEADRKNTIFVFVSPRRWGKKDSWVKGKRTKKEWKDVRAYDAVDLEQWLESSIPAQVWFAEHIGIPALQCMSLHGFWKRWSTASQPSISMSIFQNNIDENIEKIRSWITDPNRSILKIGATSREEGAAFLAALVSRADDLSALADQAVVSAGGDSLSRITESASNLIPVCISDEAERIVVSREDLGKVIIIVPPHGSNQKVDFNLGPSNYESFHQAIADMGIAGDVKVQGAGRSPTILRRLYAKSPVFEKPLWAQSSAYRNWMVPVALCGYWATNNRYDQDILRYLTDIEHYKEIESRVAEMAAVEDPPVWQEGSMRGVSSKLDALHAVIGVMSDEDFDRFLFVAELVLSEDDPSLDLPKEDRWAAEIFDKRREFSPALRQGVADTLVLLAVQGEKLSGSRNKYSFECKTSKIVERLLKGADSRKWMSRKSFLHYYAEAAPETFMSIVEEELQKEQANFDCLFEPADTGVMGSCDRTEMLWALELLAWNPRYLSRAINILAELCRYELDDNWSNKPIESIKDILLPWKINTAADAEQRKTIVENLCRKFPEIGWSFCYSQLDSSGQFTTGTHQPRWREDDYAPRQGPTRGEVQSFREFCLEQIISFESFDIDQMKKLIRLLGLLEEPNSSGIVEVVENWYRSSPPDAEVAQLRECVRRTKVINKKGGVGKRLFDLLKPMSQVENYRWLFEDVWVEYSQEELEIDKIDHKKRRDYIEAKRIKSIEIIWKTEGLDGLLKLCDMGATGHIIGSILSEFVFQYSGILEFCTYLIQKKDGLVVDSRKSCIAGALSYFNSQGDARLLEALVIIEKNTSDERLHSLFALAPPGDLTWRVLENQKPAVAELYWLKTKFGWVFLKEQEQDKAVRELLDRDRPVAAFAACRMDLESLDSNLIVRILDALQKSDPDEVRQSGIRSWDIGRAFKLLNERNDVSSAQLVPLEFRYVGVFSSRQDYQCENLAQELASSPGSFFQMVALAYRRDDGKDDDPSLSVPEDRDQRRHAAELANKALEIANIIPGTGTRGEIDEDRLKNWIRETRELAYQHCRVGTTDHQIGELLSRFPIQPESKIWPDLPIIEALEMIGSDEVSSGVRIGIYNSRGATSRPIPENGDQERVLASQFRSFANAVVNNYPFVGSILHQIADGYDQDAKRHDQYGRLESKLPYR